VDHRIELPDELKHFSGTAPLFPLPNLVLFPHIAQPLHIFEPRYRVMMNDVLSGERLIAMALLKPGYKQIYETKHPAIHPVVCLGIVTEHEKLEDGRYNLILKALCRAQILGEYEDSKPYRSAELELLQGINDLDDAEVSYLSLKLRDLFTAYIAKYHSEKIELLPAGMSLEVMCDIVSYVMKFDPPMAQQLLNISKISERACILIKILQASFPDESSDKGPIMHRDSMN
jgi:Lon protease-like protein